MIIFYFSGTGNSKYVAEKFAEKYIADCISIEEKVDFGEIISKNDLIGFCYPIYGSCVPSIMREFLETQLQVLKGKKIAIFCTQLLFSGDGAAAFARLIPTGWVEVVYAEHFRMPNNICNFPLFPVTNGEQNRKYLIQAERKIDRIIQNMKEGTIVRRGFNPVSKLLGLSQNQAWPKIEQAARGDVRVTDECVRCGKCVDCCPKSNLLLVAEKIEGKGDCTVCYRCVNRCPKRAITVMIHRKPKVQYKGV